LHRQSGSSLLLLKPTMQESHSDTDKEQVLHFFSQGAYTIIPVPSPPLITISEVSFFSYVQSGTYILSYKQTVHDYD